MPGGIGRRSFLLLVGLAAMGGRARALATEERMADPIEPSSSAPGSPAPGSSYQRLLDLARRRGRVPVIVGLAVAAAEADDEAAIARTQRQLLADLGVAAGADGSLAGPGITGVKLYETIPFIALTADADALRRLMRHRLVVSIVEDSAVPPN